MNTLFHCKKKKLIIKIKVPTSFHIIKIKLFLNFKLIKNIKIHLFIFF